MATKKITELDAIGSVADADVVEIVDDVAGTPTSKKATVAQLAAAPAFAPVVASVNGQTGPVVLDAGDVGADPAGTASSALSSHEADTSNVHGASAISVTDSGNLYTATDVEGVLAELPSQYVSQATFPGSVSVALSDMTTQITTGTTKAYWVNPFDTALTITKVKATLATAGSGATVVDINEGAGVGTSILSTKITIDASETDSDDATTPPVISDTSIAADGRLTFDIDTAGTSAAGLMVHILFTRAA
jgi:hypothetical protein